MFLPLNALADLTLDVLEFWDDVAQAWARLFLPPTDPAR